MHKNIFYFLLTFTSLFFFSCGSDDDSCTADAWVGTWVGQISCNDGSTGDISLSITKVDDNTISINDGSSTYDVAVTGCDISDTTTETTFLGDVTITVKAALSGNNLTWDIDTELLGQSLDCDGSLTKQ